MKKIYLMVRKRNIAPDRSRARIDTGGTPELRKNYVGVDKGRRGGIIEGKGGESASNGSNQEKTTTNAAGQTVRIVDHIDIIGEPNSITQIENSNGGIDRNYYGADGKQTKQISNHDHGHPKQHLFGKYGEHAHDYVLDENGIPRHGKAREMTDEEKKENGDML